MSRTRASNHGAAPLRYKAHNRSCHGAGCALRQAMLGAAGAALPLGERAAFAGGVDEPCVPLVAGQHPPPRVRVLSPDRWPRRVSLIPMTLTGGRSVANRTRTCTAKPAWTTGQLAP